MLRHLGVVLLLLSGCAAGEFASWPENCACALSRTNSRVVVRCPDANGEGRGVLMAVSSKAHVQVFAQGALLLHRTGQEDIAVLGARSLVEYGAKADHQGAAMYPLAFHKLYFPKTEGYESLGGLAEKTELVESRLDEATFWCEDADAN